MSYDLPRLRDLEARLERATGPDRYIDQEIFAIEYGWFCPLRGDALREFEATTRESGRTNYTASIDAADALRRRVLPGSGYSLAVTIKGNVCASIWLGDPNKASLAKARSEPLAILLATIRALIAREEGR